MNRARKMIEAYKTSLFRLARRPSRELEALKSCWPDVLVEINAQRKQLDRKIHENDPIRETIDLLSPLGRIEDENVHSRALAYLLNPKNTEHGYNNEILASLLEKVKDLGPRGSEAGKILTLLRGKRTEVHVTREFRDTIDHNRHGSLARYDIRVELKGLKHKARIIIENKINAPEGSGQLQAYAQKARSWGKANSGRVLLLYLAPTKRDTTAVSDGWISLSYLDLASCLRKVWMRKPSAAGRSWLALYIVSVARGVLGFDINRLHNTSLEDLKTYLGEGN
jgi:PD-(D/E)XK nuclease superfamily